MNFHIWMKVVCVDATPFPLTYHSVALEKGRVYTIRELLPWRSWALNQTVMACRLEEITTRPNDFPYLLARFRPVKTTDISIFTKMLAPTPKEREMA